MSSKILKNKFKDLIILTTADGKTHELWGLVKATRDKRQQDYFDQDYISTLCEQLNSSNPLKAKEAQEALIFLNASVLAELDGNFKYLKEIGIEPSETFKKEVYNSRNAQQRDYVSNNKGAQDELSDLTKLSSASTIGEMVDYMRTTKKNLRKQGKSVSELHRPKSKKADKDKTPALPVKKYTAEELAKFNQDYFNKKGK